MRFSDYVHDGLVLNFDDYNELVISVPLQPTLPAIKTSPAEVVAIDPNDPADHERPLFDSPCPERHRRSPSVFLRTVIRSTCTPMIASPHGNCMQISTCRGAWRQASCERQRMMQPTPTATSEEAGTWQSTPGDAS